MSGFTVIVATIDFKHDEKRGENGAVWYLILGEPCEDVVCPVHPKVTHHYERQGFRLGSHGHRLDATEEEKANDKANVWGWDGNHEAPTVTPSFLAKKDRPYVLHSFLRAGRLELCGDSTVAFDPAAVSCWP